MCPPYFRQSIAGLLALTFAASLFAHGQFWDFLGYTRIDRAQDHASIQIARRDRLFGTLQVHVTGEPIFFDRIVVHFATGPSQELVVAGRISPGGSNYVIDLPGERRVLESVELWYYKEPWSHIPAVTVYGIRLPDRDEQVIAREH